MPIARAAELVPPPVKPAISEEAGSAVSRMGKALLAQGSIVYDKNDPGLPDESGQPLHIFHTLNVVVRRPGRLAGPVYRR